MKKKGISAIVATVLIILITVAAVTILWAAIIPMIKGNVEEGISCFDAISQVSIGEQWSCIDTSNVNDSYIDLQITRDATDFNLADVQTYVITGGDSVSIGLLGVWMTSNGTDLVTKSDLPKLNQEKVFRLNISAQNITNADKISVAPSVEEGNSKKTCEVSATIDLTPC